jgi:hypothetical protein
MEHTFPSFSESFFQLMPPLATIPRLGCHGRPAGAGLSLWGSDSVNRMEEIIRRIQSLDGMHANLLANLANRNPTLLQLELLSSTDAVEAFISGSLPERNHHILHHLDNTTLALYALLEPSDAQMRILCTPGAVQEFVRLKMDGKKSVDENAVGRLQDLMHPEIVAYNISPHDHGFLCECRVGSVVHSAKAPNKRMAKHLAASSMLDTMLQSKSD